MSEKLVELTIEDLAFDGKAVARHDGKIVFCNGGLPGEVVKAEIIRSRPRYDTARVLEIVHPSDIRIQPHCSHFGHCGGCTWQDLSYDQQLAYKKNQVEQCLARLGKFEDAVVQDVLGSPDQFAYRNKMEFSFNVTEDGGCVLGLHRRGRWQDIFDLEHCHLTSERVNRIVEAVRSFVIQEGLPAYNVADHTGYVRFLVFRECAGTDQILVNLVTNYGALERGDVFVEYLLEREPGITTIVHNENGQKSNIAVGEIEHTLYGPGYVEEEIGGYRFQIRANSFFQTNSRQAERLYELGLGLLNLKGSDRLLDLYCGTGTIGILASAKVAEVVGVELVADAVRAAEVNAEVNSVTNIRFREGHAKTILREIQESGGTFEVAVVDPPRAGLNPKALKTLLNLAPERLLYISCNPSTFARDAKEIVRKGYVMGDVHPVDMFPHTMHIELATCFERISNVAGDGAG